VAPRRRGTTTENHLAALSSMLLIHTPCCFRKRHACGLWLGSDCLGHQGVNNGLAVATTLHTGPGCDQSSVPTSLFTGTPAQNDNHTAPARDCWVQDVNQGHNQGCQISASSSAGSYGRAFNAAGGGVFALLWDHHTPAAGQQYDGQFQAWFFGRQQIPPSLTGHVAPDPSHFGKPFALFRTSQSSCPASHFQDQQMIFDITLCGQWAGRVFDTDCPGHAVRRCQ
jgi:hypothetical protein